MTLSSCSFSYKTTFFTSFLNKENDDILIEKSYEDNTKKN
jgi:hypothetical protein